MDGSKSSCGAVKRGYAKVSQCHPQHGLFQSANVLLDLKNGAHTRVNFGGG
jgi:hypothetical protein